MLKVKTQASKGLSYWKRELVMIVVLGLMVFGGGVRGVAANSVEELQKQINELSKLKQMSEEATAPLEAELAGLEKKIDNIEAGLVAAENETKVLGISIDRREEELGVGYKILALRVRSYYKLSRHFSPLLLFLASGSASDLTRQLSYRSAVADQDKTVIRQIAEEIIQLEEDKQRLEENKIRLAALREKFDSEAAFFRSEVAGAKAYQGALAGKIAELSAKQQEILAAKFASAPVPLLAYTSLGGCSSDMGKSSGFSPKFGFFSFGVPNKTGMNQYGAKGRAESGVASNYEDILRAYYNFDLVDYGTGFNITVNGTNEYGQTFNNEAMNIEEYLKHLYEMPTGWDMKALQAQAVAARSYALARTNNGQNSIPPNQSGQVVKKELNDQRWQDAVKSTEGKVMVNGGSPISAWYSSTHGGFVLSSGEIGWNSTPWTKHAVDAGSASNINDLKNTAFDRGSPWFFCDWGYRGEYNNTAWLRESEVVDIVNAYILWERDNNTISHLSQTDKGIPYTWSADRVRQEITNRGGSPIGSIGSISVGWDGSGISKTIGVSGRSFNAQKFKNLFNLRAPANIQIKPTCQPDSSLNCSKMYALYDVVRE